MNRATSSASEGNKILTTSISSLPSTKVPLARFARQCFPTRPSCSSFFSRGELLIFNKIMTFNCKCTFQTARDVVKKWNLATPEMSPTSVLIFYLLYEYVSTLLIKSSRFTPNHNRCKILFVNITCSTVWVLGS